MFDQKLTFRKSEEQLYWFTASSQIGSDLPSMGIPVLQGFPWNVLNGMC